MYLRRCYRRKDGKRHAYWALVESYRTARGPRQRVVAYLGELDEQGRLGVEHAAQPESCTQPDLFEQESGAAWVEVDLRGVRVERSRPFGGGWLGLMLLRQLGLSELLEELLPPGREEVPWSAMILVLVLGRLLDPSSELHLAEHGYEASALAELLGVPTAKVNDDRLYRTLDRLLPHKPSLEKHLKQRLGELFDLDYDLLLYDVTSTYFEGAAAANPQAQRGYSRDHRPDCKQVNIALVVSRSGMPLGYEVFAGNRADVSTQPTIMMSAPDQPRRWQLRQTASAANEVDVPLNNVRLATDDAWTVLEAALAEVGYAVLLYEVCAGDLATSRLVEALPGWEGIPGLIHALYPSFRALTPALRGFLDALTKGLAAPHLPEIRKNRPEAQRPWRTQTARSHAAGLPRNSSQIPGQVSMRRWPSSLRIGINTIFNAT